MKVLDHFYLKYFGIHQIDGEFKLPDEVFSAFLKAPYDILPQFKGLGKKWDGRGKDHPRYGRFLYALAKTLQPQRIVEIGTLAGGTAIGWARAITENKKGFLTCIDNNSYGRNIYPTITKENILATGLSEDKFSLLDGDSGGILKKISVDLKGTVDIFLVDADHTYEGALSDIKNGLPMVKPGGLILVHDVDIKRKMAEETPEHPYPVYEVFKKIAEEGAYKWSILKFIRKHLGIIQI
jgi:predicted O-methyltransferase YrrM